MTGIFTKIKQFQIVIIFALALYLPCSYLFAQNSQSTVPVCRKTGEQNPPPPEAPQLPPCAESELVSKLHKENPYEVRTKELEDQWLGGHDFNKAAHSGMRGSGHLFSDKNPDAQALAERLKGTSENLDTAGQIGRVGTYAGYGAGVASIGAATINYVNRKRSDNKTAAEISDIASKASFGVGAANLSTGAYGWWISRKYEKEGYEKANELQVGLNKNSEQYANLEAAKKHFKEARLKAKEASLDMVINGAVNVAVGGAALAVKEKVEKSQELQSLGNNGGTITSSSSNSGNSPTSTNPYDPNSLNGGSSNGSETTGTTNAGSYPKNQSATLVNTFVPQTPARGITGMSGASAAPSASNNGARTIASISGSTPTNHPARGGGEAPSEDTGADDGSIATAETPEEESSYSAGGRGLSNVSSTDDEKNPIASVFGQLSQMVNGNKNNEPVKKFEGNFSPNAPEITLTNIRLQQNLDEVDASDAPEIFRSIKKKHFKMKFGGNL